jgi:hypothetical protein
MTSCWTLKEHDTAQWQDAGDCETTNQWLPDDESSSISCQAIACYVISCAPGGDVVWGSPGTCAAVCVLN